MPLDHNDPDSGTFNYVFQHVVNGPTFPTIIHVPGGPGQTLIGLDTSELPGSYNHILLDPRTIGCNYLDEATASDEVIDTFQHASDIIKIVEELSLTNYVVYGVYYGTVVATSFSDTIKDRTDIALPTAIVMEGVVGAPVYGTEYSDEFKNQWARRLSLSPRLRTAFANQANLPFGYTVDQWNTIISTLISIGGKIADDLLDSTINPQLYRIEVVKEIFDSFIGDGAEASLRGTTRFYNLVGCRELFNDTRYFNYLTSGTFEVYDLENFLEDGVSLEEAVQSCNAVDLDRPFNPEEYVMADVPTYYFQGQHDPNTPLAKARIHFNSQDHLSQSYFVEIANGGHNPLNIQLDDCKNQIWREVFNGTNPVGSTVGSTGCRFAGTSLFSGPSQSKLSRSLLIDADDIEKAEFKIPKLRR